MCKLSVAVIAQAARDIDTIQEPLCEAMLSEPKSCSGQAPAITAAYQRLERLIKALMGAEVSVRG